MGMRLRWRRRLEDRDHCGNAWRVETPGAGLAADAGGAWRSGLRRGLHCSYCCAGPTAILLAFGFMDLRAMLLVMLAVTAERLAPAGERVARGIGVVVLVAGLVLIVRATGLG